MCLDKDPRVNVCRYCGKRYPEELKRQTSLHHLIYDDDDPLAYTVEVCGTCHRYAHSKWSYKTLEERTVDWLRKEAPNYLEAYLKRRASSQ
jgi:hypothetical protein